MKPNDESQAIRERYARRAVDDPATDRYDPRHPAVACMWRERQAAMRSMLIDHGWSAEAWPTRRVLEVGCGAGGNLADLMDWGCRPEHLVGIDLLPERIALARSRLPSQVRLRDGDALQILAEPAGRQAAFDLVLLFTVLSSVLDEATRRRLVDLAWSSVSPGGLLLVYDFVVDNPRNPDVRALSLPALVSACPGAAVTIRRLTLAPPLARALCAVHPALYPVVNRIALLRTHRLVALRRAPTPDNLSA